MSWVYLFASGALLFLCVLGDFSTLNKERMALVALIFCSLALSHRAIEKVEAIEHKISRTKDELHY